MENEEKVERWLAKPKLQWYHKFCINIIKAGPIPRHIALIMDGNRRYARKENVAIVKGHNAGFKKLSESLEWCQELGIHEVTVYAFSMENFNRSKKEVDTLIELATEKFINLMKEIDELDQVGLCIRAIGNLALLPEELRARIATAVLQTRNYNQFYLNLALAYTSRDEIANSFQMISEGVRDKQIEENDIDDYLISKCMYSGASSDAQMLIRTSGEVRFSDFLLWQSWNTNVMFEKVLWPDFSIWHFLLCILYYQRHCADQNRVAKQLAFSERKNDEKVQAFLKTVERKRIRQLETFEAYLTIKAAN